MGLIKAHAFIFCVAPEPTIMKKITIEGTFSRLLRTAKT